MTDKMMHRFREKLKTDMEILADDRVIAGVSGGADSVCLLDLLEKCRGELGFSLTAVHVHHGIRGAEADRDAEFVRNFCREKDIPFILKKCDVPAYRKEHGCTEEEAARILRYRLLAEAAGECGASVIAVAHNQKDQAETVLFHILRGSSIRGLSGIAPVSDIPGERGNLKLIRPLLDFSREEIEEYLRGEGISWCTDSTNLEEVYARNRIRRQILPQAEQVNRGAERHLAHLAETMRGLDEWLESSAEKFREEHETVREDDSREIKGLDTLPEILQGMVVRKMIEECAGSLKDITDIHIRSVCGLMKKQSGRTIQLPYFLTAERTQTGLVIGRKDTEKKEKSLSVTELSGELLLTSPVIEKGGFRFYFELKEYDGQEKIPDCVYTKWFDYDKIKNGLCIRGRKTGDWFMLREDGGRKTVKSWMIDAKTEKEKRDIWPLLASADHILWITGKRTSEAFHVAKDTKRVLCVTAEII